MKRTETFRQTHTELLEIAANISNFLKPEEIQNNPQNVRSLLSKLAGKLGVHLHMEDKALYPSVFNSKDETIKAKVKKFVDEMGHIKDAFTKYNDKWKDPNTIGKESSEFISETKNVFNILSKRIDRENNELYNLIDDMK